MKFIVQDLKDLKDSREILESKPHPFTLIFIYIVLALLSAALVWSFFSEKEITVKASGMVRPSNEIYKVPVMVSSKIESMNFENGDKIQKDDILYTLDHFELDEKKKSLEDKINGLNDDLNNLDKLKKSVSDDKNYFDENNEKEKDYYSKYLNYEKSNTMSLTDSDDINETKDDVNSKINSLNLLRKSINEDKNYLDENTSYFEQYNNYELSHNQINDKISKTKSLYDSLNEDENSDKNQLEKLQSDLNTYNDELKKLKSDYILKIESDIENLNGKSKELNNNLNKVTDTNNLNKEKNKITVLSQIDDTIKSNKEKLTDLEDNLKSVNMNIEKCSIKALNYGILDVQGDFKIGDVIQAGQVIANILPDESSYEIDLFINNKDIANIKENQDVKYSFPSLPYKEYGFLNGKIETISPDSKTNKESGASFYTAKASIDNIKVHSHKKEEAEIKNGMTCEVQIVTRKEKLLYYLLEKLNLKD